MKILNKEELEKLNTKRLLAYKAKLLSAPETQDWHDSDRLSKESKEWKEIYANVKSILATREHVE